MKLLDKLIGGIFLQMFFATFAVLLTLFISISFFDLIDDFVAFKAAPKLVAEYFLMKLPEAAFNIMPMAVLIGGILAFSIISRTKEVVTMLSCGLSIWRIAAPVLVLSLLISGSTFAMGELLMPLAYKRAHHIFNVEIRKQSSTASVKQEKLWVRATDDQIWNIGLFDIKKGELRDLTIMKISPDKSRFSQIIKAKWAEASSNGWLLRSGYKRSFDEFDKFTDEVFYKLPMDVEITLHDLKEGEKRPEEMNISEIYSYIHLLKKSGYDDTKYRVDMYLKIAFPLICLVMAFMAVPFSITIDRVTGGLAGVTLGMFLGFLFWFFLSMGVSIGHSGKLPPLLSTFGTHIAFMTFAIYRINRMFKKD